MFIDLIRQVLKDGLSFLETDRTEDVFGNGTREIYMLHSREKGKCSSLLNPVVGFFELCIKAYADAASYHFFGYQIVVG